MKATRGIREQLRRYTAFIASLFILALGVALTLRAELGSSPISCPPYVLSRVPEAALTIGGYIFCMQFFFVVGQILLLRRNFQKIQLLQLAVCLLFGCFTDFAMFLTAPFQWDSSLSGYTLRWIQLAVGGVILGIGVAWEVRCDVLMIPGEGLPATIAKVFHIDFGKVKIVFDVTLVLISGKTSCRDDRVSVFVDSIMPLTQWVAKIAKKITLDIYDGGVLPDVKKALTALRPGSTRVVLNLHAADKVAAMAIPGGVELGATTANDFVNLGIRVEIE